MKSYLTLFTIVTLALCATPFIKQVAADTPPTIDTSISPTAYTVKPDDVMAISVMGFSDLTQQAVVLPDGTVTLPLLGAVKVVNQTPIQIEVNLTKLWSKYVVNPSVTVNLVQKHHEFVTFSGYVLHPGIEDYKPNYHVIEALADNGGPLTTGDLSKVTITSATGQAQVLDLSHPEDKTGTPVDVILDQGDVVYVPEQRAQVTVVGDVAHPGSYDYKENMTVLNALDLAGEALETADLSNATLLHNGQDTPLNLDALVRQGDMSKNVILSAGDRITIPEGNRTYVYGAVSHPGYYTFKAGDKLLDALNAAGGPAPGIGGDKPDLGKVNLIRVNKATNVAVVQVVNLQKLLDKGDTKENLPLEPADIVYIPTKSHHFAGSDLLPILSSVPSALIYKGL